MSATLNRIPISTIESVAAEENLLSVSDFVSLFKDDCKNKITSLSIYVATAPLHGHQ